MEPRLEKLLSIVLPNPEKGPLAGIVSPRKGKGEGG